MSKISARTVGRVALGGMLVTAGITHLTVARRGFQAQVPDWVPFEKDEVVLMSGIAELGLGGALLLLTRDQKRVGKLAAVFFTAIFPGNLAQYMDDRDSLGLDTELKRFVRLFGQPALIALALWSTRGRR